MRWCCSYCQRLCFPALWRSQSLGPSFPRALYFLKLTLRFVVLSSSSWQHRFPGHFFSLAFMSQRRAVVLAHARPKKEMFRILMHSAHLCLLWRCICLNTGLETQIKHLSTLEPLGLSYTFISITLLLLLDKYWLIWIYFYLFSGETLETEFTLYIRES